MNQSHVSSYMFYVIMFASIYGGPALIKRLTRGLDYAYARSAQRKADRDQRR